MKKSRTSILFLAFMLLPPFALVGADEKEKTLEATGRAAGTDPSATERATRAALRRAVEQAAGVFLYSQSQVVDYALTRDHVLAESGGFVQNYEVIERKIEGGATVIRVRATVLMGRFRLEWGRIRLLIEQKGRPRVMINFSQRHFKGGKFPIRSTDKLVTSDATDIVRTEFERLLLSHRFHLVDRDQVRKLREIDIESATLTNDLASIVAAGRRLGAEVMIVGTLASGQEVEVPIPGTDQKVRRVQLTLTARAIRVDTATVIASTNRTVTVQSASWQDAFVRALQKGGSSFGNNFLRQILDSWIFDVQHGSKTQIHIRGIEFEHYLALESTLRKDEDIRSVHAHEFAEGQIQIDVVSRLSTTELGRKLIGLGNPPLRVIRMSQNRIDVGLRQ